MHKRSLAHVAVSENKEKRITQRHARTPVGESHIFASHYRADRQSSVFEFLVTSRGPNGHLGFNKYFHKNEWIGAFTDHY